MYRCLFQNLLVVQEVQIEVLQLKVEKEVTILVNEGVGGEDWRLLMVVDFVICCCILEPLRDSPAKNKKDICE